MTTDEGRASERRGTPPRTEVLRAVISVSFGVGLYWATVDWWWGRRFVLLAAVLVVYVLVARPDDLDEPRLITRFLRRIRPAEA